MNGLAVDGLVLVGVPLAGSEEGRLRALLVVNAGSEAEVHRRFVDDPWMHGEQLVTASVDPWKILVGEERLGSVHRF
jgi:hypothetical protein